MKFTPRPLSEEEAKKRFEEMKRKVLGGDTAHEPDANKPESNHVEQDKDKDPIVEILNRLQEREEKDSSFKRRVDAWRDQIQ